MNGLAKRKGKSLLSNYLHPLSKKKDVLSCVFFYLTIVWFETTKTKKKKNLSSSRVRQIGID